MNCFFSSSGGIDTKFSKSTSVYSTPGCTCQETKSSSEAPSRVLSDYNGESAGGSNSYACFSDKPNNLRAFSLIELKTATRNFNRSLLLGEGGFGCVYKGIIRCLSDPSMKITVAVKQLGRRGLQGHKEWVTEVNVLGVVEHPNLVKLIGYCADDDERGIQRLLVYEFMPNRSVDDHLSGRSKTHLPWETRVKIARDAARGLSYLHEGMDPQIIFRDFKASNILLDEHFNAKLSDFGLARLGPADGFSHVSTAAVGTNGYTAPEYFHNGRLSSKNDVWSYGVFLYELITGRRPIDPHRPKNEQSLLEWVKPYLSEAKKFRCIIDPKMGGGYNLKSVQKIANVANRCLSRRAKSRPKMTEVVEMVEQVVGLYQNLESPMKLVAPMEEATAEKEVDPSRLRRLFAFSNISCQCCV